MVRLKAILTTEGMDARGMFQFQNGAIKSDYFRFWDNLETCFNSKMVRLKAE